MKNKIAIFLLSTASLSSAFGAQIYNNGSFNSLGGNAMGDFLESDDFTWPTLTTFSGFTFFTLEANGTYLGSVTWSIRANSAGRPSVYVPPPMPKPLVFEKGYLSYRTP